VNWSYFDGMYFTIKVSFLLGKKTKVHEIASFPWILMVTQTTATTAKQYLWSNMFSTI
jgi:hypothetical protein